MKTINKIKHIVLIMIVGLSFIACEEDIAEREESYVPTGDEVLAYFPSELITDFILPLGEDTASISVARQDSTNAAEVALTLDDPYGKFTIPSQVNFLAGEASKEVLITFSGIEAFEEYTIYVTIDETETNPYVEDTLGTPQIMVSIFQSDWEPYATGQYTSWWYGATYAQDLEYSPKLERYRFPDVIAEGYALEFEWLPNDTVFVEPKAVTTGYVHDDYGMVSATTTEFQYAKDTKTFTFHREWTVSAGSFGDGDDTFVMD